MKKKVDHSEPPRPSRFQKIIQDIESVKIQGAENVARAGIKAFLIKPTKAAAKKINKTRPTEPLLQNAIKGLMKSKNPKEDAERFLKDLKKAHGTISKKGASLIRNGMNIYTHCHSSTVIDILKYAKRKRKKRFVVYTSEVEPLLQGRMTARDLAKAGIKVIVTPDLGAEHALKKCDLLLFGADAFTKTVVANKLGTHTLTRIAKEHHIPRYSCGVSKKFTKKLKIEKRPGREVWDEREDKIIVINPAFDKTPLKMLSGVISEFGILPPKKFVKTTIKSLKKK